MGDALRRKARSSRLISKATVAATGRRLIVNLLTLHSAKGCEYDVVVMVVGMDMGAMPWRRETAAELLESCRLFHVGLTRAHDAVHMLYSGWIPGRYGQHLGRSPFVDELEDRLIAAERTPPT